MQNIFSMGSSQIETCNQVPVAAADSGAVDYPMDTNGGALPHEIEEIVIDIIKYVPKT